MDNSRHAPAQRHTGHAQRQQRQRRRLRDAGINCTATKDSPSARSLSELVKSPLDGFCAARICNTHNICTFNRAYHEVFILPIDKHDVNRLRTDVLICNGNIPTQIVNIGTRVIHGNDFGDSIPIRSNSRGSPSSRQKGLDRGIHLIDISDAEIRNHG